MLLLPLCLTHGVPHTVFWSGEALARQRHDQSPPVASARAELLQLAKAALDDGPFAVTNKTVAPPSGDKHDYWSVASYFWPCNVVCNRTLWSDCSRWCMPPYVLSHRQCIAAQRPVVCNESSGLPWISHDGYPRGADRSGRYLRGDRFRADGVLLSTSKLVLAWWFSDPPGGEEYLRRAVLLLRTFFLDASSGMNPNLDFAQGVPGIANGEPGGIVDLGRLYFLLDAVTLVQSDASTAAVWTPADRGAFAKWLAALLEWWLGSPAGKAARTIKNNIGDSYDLNGLAMSTFLRNESAATDLATTDAHRRIDKQINGSGALPLEDARSNSFNYHTGCLLELFVIAAYANNSGGVDLFSYVSPASGAGLRTALDWLAPHCASNGTTWPFPMSNNSGETIQLSRCRLLYTRAAEVWRAAPQYRKVAVSSGAKSATPDGYYTLGLATDTFVRLVF